MLASALLLSSVACGSKDDEGIKESSTKVTSNDSKNASEAKEEVKTKEVQELTFTLLASWVKGGLEAVADHIEKNAQDLGAKIVFDKLPDSEMGNQVLKTRFASGQYPDIIARHDAQSAHVQLGGAENFADLSGEWTDNFSSDILKSTSFTIENRLIGAPLGAINIGGMLYNKEVFAELGIEVPTTWDEFLLACETVKSAGKVPVYYSGADPWTLQIIPILGFGRELVGQDVDKVYKELNTNQQKFGDKVKFMESLSMYKDIKDKGYVNENFLSDTYDNAQKALVDGEAAMYPMATWVLGGMKESFGEEAVNNIGAFAVPFDGNDPVSAWMPWSILVPEEGANKDLAVDVVQFMLSKESQQIFYNAEPSIPLMKGLDVDLLPADKDLYAIFSEEGRGLPEFTGKVLYGQGPDFGADLQSLILDEISPEEILDRIDESRKQNAITKDDKNWK